MSHDINRTDARVSAPVYSRDPANILLIAASDALSVRMAPEHRTRPVPGVAQTNYLAYSTTDPEHPIDCSLQGIETRHSQPATDNRESNLRAYCNAICEALGGTGRQAGITMP